MDKRELEGRTTAYLSESGINVFDGVTLFESPVFGYGLADDALYEKLKQSAEANMRGLIMPKVWLPSAKTCISVFMPFSEKVTRSNRNCGSEPSREWLYGRIEGQETVASLTRFTQKLLTDAGFKTVAPLFDERLRVVKENADPFVFGEGASYTSTWSERHNAYICGLGTFGASRSFISKKGAAGRLFSLITEAPFEKTERDYTGIYDYCSGCMTCAKKCPCGAISKAGKDNAKCAAYLAMMKEKFAPRYGCGKCQCGVPCERQNPRGL